MKIMHFSIYNDFFLKKALKQFNSRDFTRISREMIAKYMMTIEKIFGGLLLTLYVWDYYKIGSNDLSETGYHRVFWAKNSIALSTLFINIRYQLIKLHF